jgi:hypothetical protein
MLRLSYYETSWERIGLVAALVLCFIDPAAASGSSATTVPLTKLSFTDIVSGQVRNPFNPH